MKNILKNRKINKKTVLKIYKRDIKNIATNYVTLIIITAVCCLPALYAWFNIQAAWDPYSRTKGLLVAVVNLDNGSELKDVKVNVGNDVIKKLKTNDAIGWTFVNADQAKEGVKYGKYYASLTIDKDFSKDFLSIGTLKDPTKAKLIYTVNEKTNAIAPKITASGASSLQSQITKTFIETASETIFSYLNKVGVDLQKNEPQLKDLVNTIISIDKNMPEIEKSLNNGYKESIVFQKFMKNVKKDIPTVSTGIDNTLDVAKRGNESLEKAKNSLQTVSPIVKADLALIKNTADTAESSLTEIQGSQTSNSASLKESLVTARDKYSDGINKIDNVLSLNKSINSSLNSSIIGSFINNLSDVRNEMTKQKSHVNSMINTVDSGNKVINSDITAAIQGANRTSGSMNNVMDNFDSETAPAIDDAIDNTSGLSNNAVSMLESIQGNMPLFNGILDGTNAQIDSSVKSLNEIKNKFPKVKQDIHANSEKLKTLTDDQKLTELIKILKKDGKKESDFLANPIDLVQNRVYPIPNYGSSMAPFFTTLAIWVGAYILVSLLSVHAAPFKDGLPLSTKEVFLGRYLTYASIAIMQALVTIAGNMFMLKTYVVSPIILTLFSVYVSIVFVTIIYTLASVLGKIGKSIAMIAMVLQVSGSGGTFPIELLGKFFQYINPMMPFTYAIGGMREATAGIIPSVLIKDMLMLTIFFVAFLLFGIVFKERINKKNENFAKHFNDSGLTGE